jgi:hypothetical protein
MQGLDGAEGDPTIPTLGEPTSRSDFGQARPAVSVCGTHWTLALAAPTGGCRCDSGSPSDDVSR